MESIKPIRLIDEALARLCASKKAEEWNVFKDYILPDLQRELRLGWRSKNTLHARIRHGCACFCSPAVYERILREHGEILCSGELIHHTFATPAAVPDTLTASDRAWWYDMHELNTHVHNQAGELCPVFELFAVSSPVVWHYAPLKHRISVSFSYSVAIKSDANPVWNTIRGKAIPLQYEVGTELLVIDSE